MKIRGDTSAVGEGPNRDRALLAAFLEATHRIDRRALQRPVALGEATNVPHAEPVNLEAEPMSFEAGPVLLEANPVLLEANPVLLEADATPLEAHPASLQAPLTPTGPNVRSAVAPFIFRRANLVKA